MSEAPEELAALENDYEEAQTAEGEGEDGVEEHQTEKNTGTSFSPFATSIDMLGIHMTSNTTTLKLAC